MTREEALKTIKFHEDGKCEECFEGECVDEAKGVLSGFEQGVRASVSNISEMRHLICTCPISDCPRVVAIKNTILKLLKKP